jgi:hypothetical protein
MKSLLAIVGLAGLVIVVMATGARAAEAEGVPTFNTDVAPIIFNNCASCHRDGQVAPMSLTSYQQVRPWARAIRSKVLAREMPPWFADPRFGSFRNSRGLSQEQIDTIVAWADAGAPQGTGLAPEPPVFPEGWSHAERAPDAIVEMPLELDIPSDGEVPYLSIWAENPFDEDKFVEAIQTRPSNKAVVHHAGAYNKVLPPGTRLGEQRAFAGGPLIPFPVPIDEGETEDVQRDREARSVFRPTLTDLLQIYVPGGGFQMFRPGVSKRIHKDRYFVFQMHYAVTGKPESDRTALGFWFQKEPTHHEVVTQYRANTHIVETQERTAETDELQGGAGAAARVRQGSGRRPPAIPVIPPRIADWKITGISAVTDDMTLYGLWPHMHLRGKDMTYIVTFPDGTEEIILNVPNYDFNWQVQYEFEEPMPIPAGSTIKVVAHFDNSIGNRYNPAPDKEVYWGQQSWDEMFQPFMEYSIDKLDIGLEAKTKTEDGAQP